jgi:dTMP kinase
VFICFEGIDGAGKSTQARMLQQHLAKDGYKVELVADPGTTKIGTAIRQLLLDNDGPITPVAQMLLFSAGRAELSAYASEQMRKKTVIICDRWFLSTLVYQGVMNDIPINLLENIFAVSGCVFPDICFLLDLPPAKAKKRMGKPRDRYERKCMSDRKTMREAYLEFADSDYAERTEIINAEQPAETTHHQIYTIVKSVLKDRGVKPRMESTHVRNDGTRRRRPASRT